jgi:uncharacterized protein (TIGR02246 family)
MVYRVVLAVSAILAVPCHAVAQSPAPEFVELAKQYQAAFNAGDAAKVAGLFDEHGVFMNPDGETSTGPEAIQHVYAELFEAALEATITPTASHIAGDLACVHGEYAVKNKQPPADAKNVINVRGEYVDVWKRVNGEWKLLYETYM